MTVTELAELGTGAAAILSKDEALRLIAGA
jgi:hypothetical protein